MKLIDGNIVLSLNGFKSYKGALKELGAKDLKNGYVSLPAISLNALRLVELFGEDILDDADEDIRALVEEPWGFTGFTPEEEAEAQKHQSWSKLYEYQREGVEYLTSNPHGAGLVGLSWGLGKAATVIVAADLLEARKVLVLCPLTLGPAWEKELSLWGRDLLTPRGFRRAHAGDRAPGDTGWTVANHEVIQEVVLRDEESKIIQPDWTTNSKRVKKWIKDGPTRVNSKGKKEPVRERIVRVRRDYANADWDLVIIDESVLLTNRKAVKAQILKQLLKRGDPYIWELSGSSIRKYQNDLFQQMQILMPRAFTSYWRFAEFFTIVDKGGWGWTIEGDRPDRDPKHYLRDFMWVKSEEDAGIDLPEYIEKEVPLEATERQRKALDSMLDDWIVELEDADEEIVATNWLARSTRLQQITSNLGALPTPKGEATFFKPDSAKEELLVEMLKSGDLETPLLVWTWFVQTSYILSTTLQKLGLETRVVIGGMSSEAKDASLEAFRVGEIDALILQIGTGKFGHTFTKTKSIFYHDRTFDSDAYIQSRRRVRRLGLTHRPTLIIPKVLESADQLIDANLEGKLKSIARLTNMDLAELLRTISGGDGTAA